MEINVKQRSEEWFDLRKTVQLTVSVFGDALGVGRGKPFDFLKYLLSDVEKNSNNSANNPQMQNGIDMEDAIHEAYDLLTGYSTRTSGFWKFSEESKSQLKDLVGASPDAVVLDMNDRTKPIGLCEFKAPFYAMYTDRETGTGLSCVNRIPRQYMAQMQGQLGVTGLPWCDFMAVCVKTKEILLKRVYFQPLYWKHMAAIIHQFCLVLKEARELKSENKPFLDFIGAKKLQYLPMLRSWLPGEGLIRVENLLQCNADKKFKGPSNVWLSFDFLLGTSYSLPPMLKRYSESVLTEVDEVISVKRKRSDSE